MTMVDLVRLLRRIQALVVLDQSLHRTAVVVVRLARSVQEQMSRDSSSQISLWSN